MAAEQFVLSAPLCFLFTKHGKLDKKRISSAIVNFYPTTEVIAAKEQLVKDTNAMKLDSIPRPPRRRDRENPDQREVDDIFAIVTALDERCAIKQVPRYVYDNSDYVSSARLDGIDMRVFLSKLDKIGDDVADTNSGILKIQDNVAFHGDNSSSSQAQTAI